MISKKINDILLESVSKINDAILNNNFKKLNESKYTIDIEFESDVYSIWNSNSSESTSIYSIKVNGSSFYYPEHTFRKPATCRRILRANSDKKQKEIDAIDRKINLLKEKKVKIINKEK